MKKLTRYIASCGRNVWAYPPLGDPDHLHRVGLREAIRKTASVLPSGAVIADIGCGWMPYKEWFLNEGCTYIPLDVTGYPDHRFRIIRDGKIPLSDASVDALVCWQVLEHVHDMNSFFREVRRILKPAALAFFTTHGLFRIHDREDFWRWTPMGLRLLFEEQQFADFEAVACDSTFAITASLINQAVRPRRERLMKRALFWTLCAIVNFIGLAADRLFTAIGLTGHRRESSTYMIKVRRSRDEVKTDGAVSIRTVCAPHSVSVCIAICTRNRSADLSRMLPSLESLTYPPELLRICIVDNASTDCTQQIAKTWCSHRTNAKYLLEPREGLPFARNRAWQETDAELVVYIDDDAIPEINWLNVLAEAYLSEKGTNTNPYLAVGGRVKLCLPKEFNETKQWLGDDMLGWLSQLDYGPDTFVLDKPHMHLMGANFAVPRRTLEQIGGFAEDMPGYGGDERYVEGRIRHAGGRLVYVGGAVVHHQISSDRLQPQWFRQRLRAEGKAVAHQRIKQTTGSMIGRLKVFGSGLRAMIQGLDGIIRNTLDPTPNHFTLSCRLWFAWGFLGESLLLLFRRRRKS
jgi:glycosyltransferase involved in cell wall biosynthesis/SAM-dependent methyltransferase